MIYNQTRARRDPSGLAVLLFGFGYYGRGVPAGRTVCAAYSPTGSAVWRVVLRGRSKPLPYGGNRRVSRAGDGVHDVPEFMDREA